MPKRDYVSEIADLRSRTKWNSALADITIRLYEIQGAFDARDKMPREMLRYFPVGIIACVEAYARAQIRELIDHGPPFIERAANLDLSKSSFDIELLRAIGTKTVSMGELISHLLPLNDLTDLNRHFSALFETDFLEEVKTVRDRWKVEVERQPDVPIIDDAGFVFEWVTRCFELRHIFAHEAATAITVDVTEIDNCFTAAATLLSATQQYCQNTLYPDAPLTQTDMNIRAADDLAAAEEELALVLSEVVKSVDEERAAELKEVQEKWRSYRNSWAEFETAIYQGGTIRPMLYANSAVATTRKRTEELTIYLRWWKSHMG